MSRGRHSLPEPPRSELPLTVVGLAVAVCAIVAVWLVDESLWVRVGVTCVVAVVTVFAVLSVRSTHRLANALWQETLERRRELFDVRRELSDLRAQQVELLLELRSLRAELVAAAEETARHVRAATDQSALMHELLKPREHEADPVYPSLHLPLVRDAFSTEVTPTPQTTQVAGVSVPETDASSGSEPFPPRQLLDLTAAEIARLRPAN